MPNTIDASAIDTLPVSAKWKARFHAIHRAGGPRLPHFKDLPASERNLVFGFNVLAFLFGPVYYAVMGMWRKGVSLLLLCVLVATMLHSLFTAFGWDQLARAVPYGMGAVFSLRANMDYYKHCVLGDRNWW